MSSYDQRPWLARYDEGQPHDIEVEFGSVLDMFGSCAQRDPGAPIIRYFDGVLTRRELDELSGAFVGAGRRGFRRGRAGGAVPAERAAVHHRHDRHLEGRRDRGGRQPDEQGTRTRSHPPRLRRHGAGLPGRPVPGRGRQRHRRHHGEDGDHHLGAGVPDARRRPDSGRHRADQLRWHAGHDHADGALPRAAAARTRRSARTMWPS